MLSKYSTAQLLYLAIFLKLYYYCVCVSVIGGGGQVGEVKRQCCGIGSLLLPLQTLWGSSSGYQA